MKSGIHSGTDHEVGADLEGEYMMSFGRAVVAASAAVAFAAGTAFVAPVAGAAPGSLDLGSLGASSPDTSLPADDTCDVEQIVTPSNLADSGWSTPDDETPAAIAAVTEAMEGVGPAALTFPADSPENKGTSLYKDADEMPLADLLEDDVLKMNFDYSTDGQAPALQIRLNEASLAISEEGESGYDVGFATIVWSPESGDGTWKSANAATATDFWVTRDLKGADDKTVTRGTRMSLETIVELNTDAVVTEYGVQKTTDNVAKGVAIDNFTFGCVTTNFELDPEDTGSLSGVFGSLTGSLSS